MIVDRLDDTADLYGPAPQTAFLDPGKPNDRLFQRLAEHAQSGDVTKRLEREMKFDPDLWVVAIEDRDGRSFLDIAPS